VFVMSTSGFGGPDGLVVLVVKDADRNGIVELTRDFGTISAKARARKLTPSDLSGGTFSISRRSTRIT
jgi:pyruvate dehydrogenase E2 component (dihydrolipoamide acetyltransferase)